jgi:hypothetical protein
VETLCLDDKTRELFQNPQPVPQEPKKPQGAKHPAIDEDEAAIMKVRDPEIREMALEMMKIGRTLLDLKRRGNRLAAAALKEAADQFIHDAGLLTNPEVPRGRKVNAEMNFLRPETNEG